jgi:hypothetical protein
MNAAAPRDRDARGEVVEEVPELVEKSLYVSVREKRRTLFRWRREVRTDHPEVRRTSALHARFPVDEVVHPRALTFFGPGEKVRIKPAKERALRVAKFVIADLGVPDLLENHLRYREAEEAPRDFKKSGERLAEGEIRSELFFIQVVAFLP